MLNSIKPFVRPVKRKLVQFIRARTNRFRSNAEIFDRIYARNGWGGAPGQIYSGGGTYGEAADRYVEAVLAFIAENKIERVVDIGCGDFSIGARIAPACKEYIGVDVSSRVVAHNRHEYKSSSIKFIQCDAARDTLPPGDACLIRQVLQHLSNADIALAMANVLRRYSVVIVTEHYPSVGAFKAFNLDKPTGADIRVYDGSAVYLDRAPFDVTVTRTMLDIPLTLEQTVASTRTENPSTWEHLKTFIVQPKGAKA